MRLFSVLNLPPILCSWLADGSSKKESSTLPWLTGNYKRTLRFWNIFIFKQGGIPRTNGISVITALTTFKWQFCSRSLIIHNIAAEKVLFTMVCEPDIIEKCFGLAFWFNDGRLFSFIKGTKPKYRISATM